MALLPDPTTAASERSSVKNRLTGSRRRGSGINRHRSRTVSKTSLEAGTARAAGPARDPRCLGGSRASRGGSMGGAGALGAIKGCLGGVQGVPGGSRELQRFWAEKAKNTKKPEKRSGTVWLAYCAATSRILCRRFQ